MAQIKITAVDKRTVTLDIAWDDGLTKTGAVANDVPVESFEAAQAYLFNYVTGLYNEVKAEADALAYANPTIAPEVLAAVGHTFDDQGNVIS
jgi:hypothetical protein